MPKQTAAHPGHILPCLRCSREQQLTSLHFQRHAYSLLLSSLISLHHFIWCQSIYSHCCCAKCGPESPNGKHFQLINAAFLNLIYCLEEPHFLSASHSLGSKTQSLVEWGGQIWEQSCISDEVHEAPIGAIRQRIQKNAKFCRRQFRMT